MNTWESKLQQAEHEANLLRSLVAIERTENKRLRASNAELLNGLRIAENSLAFAGGEIRNKVALELVRKAIAAAREAQ